MRFPNPFSFVKALGRVVYAFLQGKNPLVDEETYTKRVKICGKCPWFDSTVRQCNLCTCQVDLKAQFRTESCPKGFWKPVRLTIWGVMRPILKTCHSLRKMLR